MNTEHEERVGARPRHGYTTTETSHTSDEPLQQQEEGDGLVGILARSPSQEDESPMHDTEDDDARPLSPAILATAADNVVVGSIMNDSEDSDGDERHTRSTETDPLLQQDKGENENLFVNEAAADLQQQQQQQRQEEEESTSQADEVERINLTISPYDYDTNWDMIGHCRQQEGDSEEDLLNRSGASLLAEAAAATAMLASTASTLEEPPNSPPTTVSPPPLQGIAAASPSSEYEYNVNWDMVGRVNEGGERDLDGAKEDGHTAPCSSLAQAAAVTAMLQNTTQQDEQETGGLQRTKSADADDLSLQDTVPLGSRTRSTPSRLHAPSSSRRTHHYNRYRHTRSTSADNLESLHDVANEHSRADEDHPDTRSEMNESTITTITTSTTSSSSGSATRRRRQGARRYHGSSSWTSFSEVRSRRGAGSVVASSITTASNADSHNTASTASSSSRLRASLDSGMASVRRWIRSRGNAQQQPRSSRAARRWQREHSDTMQLGEEDLFALTNAGEDPRGRMSSHDDSSVVRPLYFRSNIEYPPSIQEEPRQPRQRSLSEPDGNRLRNFFFERAATGGFRRRRSSNMEQQQQQPEGLSTTSAHLQRAALSSSLFHTPERASSWSVETTEQPTESAPTTTVNNATSEAEEASSIPPLIENDSESNDSEHEDEDPDPNREARTRWIRINRRFQLMITMVALVFSLLLFAILVCWVVLTSAYVVSIDKKCDVPLKTYFWLATLQLILDVFRTDIMRVILRWNTTANERVPARVIVYNIVYLTYALFVLWLGIRSVFLGDGVTCHETAPELFQASTVFIILSILAWSIVVLGYLVPFCFVAMLLTWNGYTPASDREHAEATAGVAAMGAFGGVFPAAYSNAGAPPGCIDQLRVVLLEEFPEEYPQECCICMGDFCPGEVIVATECDHVFHKRCCQEWLRQARTCPVCRTDIPSSIGGGGDATQPDEPSPTEPTNNRRLGPPFGGPPRHAFGREEFHQEVVNLFRILRQHEERLRQRTRTSAEDAASDEEIGTTSRDDEQNGSTRATTAIESQTPRSEIPASGEIEMEEGRFSR